MNSLGLFLLASVTLGDIPPVITEPPRSPTYIRCDGELLALPANTQLPISCEEARGLLRTLQCDSKLNQALECIAKYKSEKKRVKCLKKLK